MNLAVHERVDEKPLRSVETGGHKALRRAAEALVSGHSIEQITVRAAHYENGLAYYRQPMPADAVPVWELGKTQSQILSG